MPLTDLAWAIRSGKISSEQVVRAYLGRIERIDRAGPRLNSILALNPDALAEARRLDAERAAGRIEGPLHGVPVLLKDTIETRDAMPTTAGSLALKDNFTRRDSYVAAALRKQGAVILGKTNLSEWSDFRHPNALSGWSGAGGQTRNPYALDRTPCGSSSGSAVAAAASLAAATVGMETNSSIVCPSSMTGVVGFKPTFGLVPLDGAMVLSPTQDTAGPIARSVADAAAILSAIAGEGKDYAAALSKDALKGKRIGVLVYLSGSNDDVLERFANAREVLRKAGAELVAIDMVPDMRTLEDDEFVVLLTELKDNLNRYLKASAPGVGVRSLQDVIAFNELNAGVEMPFFDQAMLVAAERAPSPADPIYLDAWARSKKAAGADGLDALMAKGKVDMLIAPTQAPAFLVDEVLGDRFVGQGLGSPGTMAAIAGYPHLTVPMGLIDGLPVGLSFIGRPGSDADVLAAGYAYEQASHVRAEPNFLTTIPRRMIARDIRPSAARSGGR